VKEARSSPETTEIPSLQKPFT